jgi:hypothetical protein
MSLRRCLPGKKAGVAVQGVAEEPLVGFGRLTEFLGKISERSAVLVDWAPGSLACTTRSAPGFGSIRSTNSLG